MGRHGGKSTSIALARSGYWIVKFTDFSHIFAGDPYQPRSSDSGVKSADNQSLLTSSARRYNLWQRAGSLTQDTGVMRPKQALCGRSLYYVKNLLPLPQANRILDTILLVGYLPCWARISRWAGLVGLCWKTGRRTSVVHRPVQNVGRTYVHPCCVKCKCRWDKADKAIVKSRPSTALAALASGAPARHRDRQHGHQALSIRSSSELPGLRLGKDTRTTSTPMT